MPFDSNASPRADALWERTPSPNSEQMCAAARHELADVSVVAGLAEPPNSTRRDPQEALTKQELAASARRYSSDGRARSLPLRWARGAALAQSLGDVVRRLLTVSLFYKVLVANSAIVLLGALGGTAITLHVASGGARHESFDLSLTLIFALVGLVLSGALNAMILRAAFSPLARLREVASRVSWGDLSVRAETLLTADLEIAQIAQSFNAVLDEVERYREQVRALSGSLLTAQERERQRIARELHDDTGQVLTLLLIRLKLLEERATVVDGQNLVPEIEDLRALVTSAVDQVRRLALNLRPPTIDQLGLVPALRSLANTFVASTGIEVTLELPRENEQCLDLGPDRTIAIYRVVQEALTNTAKHAQAHRIGIGVIQQGAELVIDIRDDGRGFAPEQFATPRHVADRGTPQGSSPGVGLFGMEERARLIGGTVRVQSAPGRGTLVELRVPLPYLFTGGDALGGNAHEA